MNFLFCLWQKFINSALCKDLAQIMFFFNYPSVRQPEKGVAL